MFFKSMVKPDVHFSKNAQITTIINQLNEHFQIDYSKSFFELYPFSNEYRYSEVLDKISVSEPTNHNEQIRVAILFGESNFLSMLPELSRHADLILLADIEPKLHQHTQHLLKCMKQSDTLDAFMQHYANDNPIANLKSEPCCSNAHASVLTVPVLLNMLTGKWGEVADSLKQYHFLSSAQRFNACKKAAAQLSFTHINLDLFSEIACHRLAKLLSSSNATLTLCNLTNIDDYDDGKQIRKTIPLLLNGSPHCLVMYATHQARHTNISNKIEDYFNKFDITDAEQDELADFDLMSCHNLKPTI